MSNCLASRVSILVLRSVTAAIIGWTTGLAIADDSASADAGVMQVSALETVEEIIVTGTHIRGLTMAPSPVISLTRRDFADVGATTASDMLRRLPQSFAGPTDYGAAIAANKNGNEQNLGYGSGVNLRGLGSSSTLVLLNGQRIAASGLGAFVDTSSIPLAALQRIDIVPDGASAIYGSDAVGGVVNFILREDFSGAETSMRYGGVTNGGLRETNVAQVLGTKWGTGSAMLSLSYQDQSELNATDRDFAEALTSGPTDLIPQQELRSVLLNGYQILTPTLRASATGYFNERLTAGRVYNPNSLSQLDDDVDTRHAGGTLGLEWRVTSFWTIDLAHTYSRADTELHGRLTGDLQNIDSRSKYVVDSSTTELKADGPIFAAPGGSARLAVGAEHRSESLDRVLVGLGSPVFDPPFKASRDVNALFAELNVPLLRPRSDQSAAGELSLILAGRFEDYSDFGSTTNPKLGVAWMPLDGLRLRANYGTSFRAPYLSQFDSAFTGALIFPKNFEPGGEVIAAIVQGPGPNLKPEKADIWTAGFELRPRRTPGLSISANYFHISYADRLTYGALTLDPANDPLLIGRVSTPADPAILDAISALPPAAYFDLAGVPLSDAAVTVDTRLKNTALTNVSGVDFRTVYLFDTRYGQFRAGLNSSYFFKFEDQPARAIPATDMVDTIFNPTDFRAVSSLSWDRGAWHLAGFINYVDGYEDNQIPTDVRRVPSWTTFDMSAAYTLPRSATWTSGLAFRLNTLNVFDRAPPRIVQQVASYANPGYYTEVANPLGRYVSFEMSKQW